MNARRLLLVVCAVVMGSGLLLWWASRATPAFRDTVVNALNARFDSTVDLGSLQMTVVPRPRVWGDRLVLRHDGRTDVPPLITIERFASSAGIAGLLRRPPHLRDVSLEGLVIHVPPGGLDPSPDPDDDEPRRPADLPPPAIEVQDAPATPTLAIAAIRSQRARLEIASRRANRLPRIFEIDDLLMRGFGGAEAASFTASLVNPIPRGRIDTNGEFGPWNPQTPDLTPVAGKYTFKDANLDDIKGIGGTLSSVGTYSGVLRRIEVAGETETPDFSIDLAGRPMPLATRFAAIVDGTSGDTWLDRVDARLGGTRIEASGAVVRAQELKGRRVSLDVKIDGGRIEDLLRLAVNTDSTPLTGQIDLATAFLLPQGPGTVVDRLQLDGRFSLAEATFTSIDVQRKINTLSSRGRGDEDADGSGQSVVSQLEGRFVLRNAQLSFSSLTFAVPGAIVQLAGTYDLRGETMDFKGYLLADASLADMTDGLKSMLARLAQPFFRRPGGGSRIPIRVSGSRTNPTFGLDVRRVLP